MSERMWTMSLRTLFLCAQGSSRAYIAASLLMAEAAAHFDAWATPAKSEQDLRLAQFVLQEQQVAFLSPDHLIQPLFGMHWDEGIVLCSGATDT